MPNKPATKHTAPKRSASGKPAPRKPAPKKLAPEKAAPEQAAPEKAAPEKAAPEKAAPEKVKRPGPPSGFFLGEYKTGRFYLSLIGPGYAWERIAERVAPPPLKERLSFDCEAGMFSAASADRAALLELRALLEPYRTDREKFNALQRAARKEGNV